MSTVAKREGGYTWDDYQSWSDAERWEIIGGVAYDMSAAPTTRHQRILMKLGAQLPSHFRSTSCEVFPAPIDVKLSAQDVVQPDLLIVCKRERVTAGHIDGPPTLVVEILSPSTLVKDRGVKLDLYARSGIQEVWLVTPYPSLLEVYHLDGSTYRRAGSFAKSGVFKSPVFPDLALDLHSVFDFPLDPGEQMDIVKEPPARTQAKGTLV